MTPAASTTANFAVRSAVAADTAALEELIPLSVRALQAEHYSPAQMAAALGPVFGVDRTLIGDGTYFVAEHAGVIIGCGGWSQRQAQFGGDRTRSGEDGLLDPAREAARVRAFFVHPAWARRGVGTAILRATESAIHAAGFTRIVMVATLAGEPLYARHGYIAEERYTVPLRDGLALPVVRMGKLVAVARPGVS
ncbi:MAG: GNAT family N-acetyltransferase [Opitutaceae bacterium]|nr:GNAT family N-acetyltransferase [Opitutaceae bacterium]